MAHSAGPGSHLCGHPNKHKRPGEKRRGTCRHVVSDDSSYRYCEDHRHGWRALLPGPVSPSGASTSKARQQPHGVEPATARYSTPRSVGSDAVRPRSGKGWKDDGIPDAAVDVAVEQAHKVVTDDWIRRSQRRVAAALGPDVAQRARSRGAAILCRELAKVAGALLSAKRWAIGVVEDKTVPLLGWLRRPRLARSIAHQFARHLVSVPVSGITATAHALRAYGVLLCVLDGRELARCRCLRSIAASRSPEGIRAEVREIVGRGLEPLV
jgi:hypothetical protein